jgi:histidinol-phosphate aminotransferase
MKRPLADLVPPHVHAIEPYRPGKPIEEVERELGIRAVKMASNENPFGPSPLAIEAARRALAEGHRYPEGGAWYLRRKLAERWGVEMDQVILGNGSGELLEIVARTLLTPADEGATSYGSFPLYKLAIEATGAKFVTVPLADYTFDLDALAAAASSRTKLIFVANPNNPTGTMVTADRVEAFLERIAEVSGAVVALDEAYADYVERADYTRSAEWVKSGRRVLVLRTFSKVYGLAGLRIGYGVGPAELIAEMTRLRSPFNTSAVAQAAGLAALDDDEHVRRSVERNRAGLARLRAGIERLGLCPVPSATNFLLVPLGREGGPVAEALLREGVIVRPMRWMGFPEAIRISVGTEEENEKCLAALGRVLGDAGGKQ